MIEDIISKNVSDLLLTFFLQRCVLVRFEREPKYLSLDEVWRHQNLEYGNAFIRAELSAKELCCVPDIKQIYCVGEGFCMKAFLIT